MPARNQAQWTATPKLKAGEWIDSRVYSDEKIYQEELEKVFKNTWIPLCHESEQIGRAHV